MLGHRSNLWVILGVRAVDPARSLDAEIDVVIEDGVIVRLGPGAATDEIKMSWL